MRENVDDLKDALTNLETSAREGSNESISSVFMNLEILVLTTDRWPQEFFRGVQNLLQNETFLRLSDSWKLARFLANNWDQLSEEQTAELRPILIGSFDKYQDWMGAFVTAEIIGERFTDESALTTFSELASSTELPALALVPHGLESFAQTTTAPRLKAMAIGQLKLLAASSIEEVRQEALQALRHLEAE
jgi:hypothetical protein